MLNLPLRPHPTFLGIRAVRKPSFLVAAHKRSTQRFSKQAYARWIFEISSRNTSDKIVEAILNMRYQCHMARLKDFPIETRFLNYASVHVTPAGKYIITKGKNTCISSKRIEDTTLLSNGLAFEMQGDVYDLAHNYHIARRSFIPNQLNYFIIIPTLRCNLSCTYCQVSRANESATGFDWNDDQFDQFLSFFDNHSGPRPKLEIQGGEPTLIFSKLKGFLRKLYALRPETEVVLCTNLQNLPENFFDDVISLKLQISSSLDGNFETHNANRNQNHESTKIFFDNIKECLKVLGKDRVSFLSTISDFDHTHDTLKAYEELELEEIYLRPVNYQGFARKKHKNSKANSEDWFSSYISSLDAIFQSNEANEYKLKETNFSLHAKRIFSNSFNSHVDFRNPNPVARDYIVVNYDGAFFPSDEARMLHRIGLIDLSIGNLNSGLDEEKITYLNQQARLEHYSDCNACAYKPFCGIDIVDLISKHGTVDVKMSETDHCKSHILLFDYIFSKLAENDEVFLRNLNLNITGSYNLPHFVSGTVYD